MNRKWEGVERERKRETQGQEVESEEGTHRSLFQCWHRNKTNKETSIC